MLAFQREELGKLFMNLILCGVILICFSLLLLGNWLKKPIEQDQFPLLTNEK